MKGKKNNEIFDKFNLPGYVKGKSFADASKAIQKRFEGRTDRESVETKTELMTRLRDAQEYVKQMEQAKQQQSQPQQQMGPEQMMQGAPQQGMPQQGMPDQQSQMMQQMMGQEMMGQEMNQDPSMMQNQNFMGGMMGGASGAMGAAGGYAGAAMKAMEVGNQLFGKTGVDTSGMTEAPDRIKKGNAALGGAVSGAQAGGAIVPGWGHAIGAVVGGVGGFVGADRKNKDIIEAEKKKTFSDVNALDNRYDGGGLLSGSESNGLFDLASAYQNQISSSPVGATPGYSGQPGYEPRTNSMFQNGLLSVADMATKATNQLSANPVQTSTNQNHVSNGANPNRREAVTPNSGAINTGQMGNSGVGTVSSNGSGEKGDGSGDDNKKDNKYNPAKLLRYAPVATNAYQLATLSKPETETLDRASGEYNKSYVDEESMQNVARQGAANIRDAIVGSSGGSQSRASANLLGSQLNTTKALSDAYFKSEDLNRNEDRMGEQVRMTAEGQNINQSNQEKLINAQNMAAYDNQKSKLLSSLGESVGEIGKEELLKDYPELMGMFYDSNGKLIKDPKRMKEYLEEIQARRNGSKTKETAGND